MRLKNRSDTLQEYYDQDDYYQRVSLLKKNMTGSSELASHFMQYIKQFVLITLVLYSQEKRTLNQYFPPIPYLSSLDDTSIMIIWNSIIIITLLSLF